VRIIGALQQLQPAMPPAYILENVPMQRHLKDSIATADYKQICSLIGQPAMVDAAQFGSLAHRLRNFWSNLSSPKQLVGALQHAVRPAGRTVQLALQPGRTARTVYGPDHPPFYLCNSAAQPRAAWPTLMSKQGSYAFRPQQPGSVWDASTPAAPFWDEPTAAEREVALGYLPGSTAAAGLTDRQRCAVLGQCIDANCLLGVWAISAAWWDRSQRPQPAASSSSSCCAHPSPAAVPSDTAFLAQYTTMAAQEALAAGGGASEIWTDHPALDTLRPDRPTPTLDSKQQDRVQHRLKLYRWDAQQGQLLRMLPDGSTRIVPPPTERLRLIQQQHEQCGHFGVRRTTALLATKYWWHGMRADIVAVVSRCQHCAQVSASFNTRGNREQLQSIPISSLGFRWHVDLAGPFPVSQRGSRYVLVAVEAFSKWLEVVPLVNKEPDTVAYAFLHNVLARYAAPGQVVSDNGAEWQGAFEQLLADCLIDHCTTSPAHPQANGQAEKAVDIVKQALRKMCLQRHKLDDWDSDVAWLSLGYRCSPHSSTGFAPYELLFARKPVAPPAVRSSMQQPLAVDDPAAAAVDLLQRKQLVQRLCPEALENLTIAQQRDQRRYAFVRSKGYQPRVYRFQPGDYVYVKQQQRHSTLQPQARPSILRVRQVLPSGVLELQGKCGRTAEIHTDHCAPCHLPHLDGEIDPVLITDVDHIVCEVCDREEPESHLLLCDICNLGYHTFCLQPPLSAVPSDSWLCPACVEDGYTAAEVAAREQQRQQRQQQAEQPVLFPNASMRRRDEVAAALHGRLVLKSAYDPATGKPAPYWGRVHYLGPLARPYYFLVVYQDGGTQQVTKRCLTKWLMPQGTMLPQGVAIPAAPASAASAGLGL
jgi:hypothetical protein